MVKYGGSWAKGFASTFNPAAGINLGLQWKQQKAAQKKIDDELEQLKINSMELAAKFDVARADGSITQEEYGDAMSWAIPLGKEIMGRTNELYSNYKDMTPEQLQTELDNIKAVLDFSKDLDFTNIEQMKEFGNKLTQPNAKLQWDLIIKSIEGRKKPIQPEVFPSAAAAQAAYPDTEVIFNASAGGFVPKISAPATERAPTAIDQKIAGIENLPIPEEQKLEMKIKVYGGGDTALEQKIKKAYEHGATDEEVKEMIVGGGIDIHITPETVGTLGTWEERFEKVTTEAEFNREQNLLTQSEDKFEPEHKTWKEHLVAEVEGMVKALKSYLDEKGNLKNEDWAASFKENVDTYMEKILEIQQKFPDVDLSKFPKFRGERKSILTIPYGGLIDEKGW